MIQSRRCTRFTFLKSLSLRAFEVLNKGQFNFLDLKIPLANALRSAVAAYFWAMRDRDAIRQRADNKPEAEETLT
jgi:hypothetical protein